MYGLVNKAIEELVTATCGPRAWSDVLLAAGWEGDGFIGMTAYPDELTFALVRAAAQELGRTTEQTLEALGERWVPHVVAEGFGALIAMTGPTFESALDQVDRLHAHLALTFPDYDSPAFRAERLGDGLVRVEYTSRRAGLAPLVTGILRGLAAHYGVRAEVEHERGAEHDTFLVRVVRG